MSTFEDVNCQSISVVKTEGGGDKTYQWSKDVSIVVNRCWWFSEMVQLSKLCQWSKNVSGRKLSVLSKAVCGPTNVSGSNTSLIHWCQWLKGISDPYMSVVYIYIEDSCPNMSVTQTCQLSNIHYKYVFQLIFVLLSLVSLLILMHEYF